MASFRLMGTHPLVIYYENGKAARPVNENIGIAGYKGTWIMNEIGQTVYPNFFISEHAGEYNARYTDINFNFNNKWGATDQYPGWRSDFLECWDYQESYWWDNSLFP